MGQQFQSVFAQAQHHLTNPYSLAIFDQLTACRTAALGMHSYQCDDPNCKHLHHQYHSCGNRHCPNCGGLKKEQWIENLTAQLFPTKYYHVVFTLPHELNGLIMGNRKLLFNVLFEAASSTLIQFSSDPQYLGATCGITAILHTWGQDLSFHPHLHCIVSGGGVKDGGWVDGKRVNGKFLFPVNAMKKVYKAIFLKRVRELIQAKLLQTTGLDIAKILAQAGYKSWNVYAKSPFGTVSSVIEYLGRYTHKVAITSNRIQSITEHSVQFKYKDYADEDRQKEMSLSIPEFLRRFEQHFLPKGYVKIRHYGFLQNHGKIARLSAIRQHAGLPRLAQPVKIPVGIRMLEKYGKDISLCPSCKKGRLQLIAVVYPNGNPKAKMVLGQANGQGGVNVHQKVPT